MSTIRVLAIDPHAIVRAGVRALLAVEPDLELIGEAADGPTGMRLATELDPDVIVAEVAGPAVNEAVLRQLYAGRPDRKVLVLTACEDGSALRAMITAGAIGYVLKRSGVYELLRAIRTVAVGAVYRDPAVAETIGTETIGGNVHLDGAELSERERDVVCQIALGYANKQIAARLKISVKTVETYKTRSMEKLGLRGRVDIVRYAAARGWLVPEPLPDPDPQPREGDRPAAA